MADQVTLAGSIELDPRSGDFSFPGASSSIPLSLTPAEKQVGAAFTCPIRQISSSDSYVVLEGVGDGAAVTQASLLYLRTGAPFLVRLTCADPNGGADSVAVVPLHGTAILEFQQAGFLKRLEVQGVGAVEYLASGPA